MLLQAPSSPLRASDVVVGGTPAREDGLLDFSHLPFASPNMLPFGDDLADLPEELLLKSPPQPGRVSQYLY